MDLDSLGRRKTIFEPGESKAGLQARFADILKDPTPDNIKKAVELATAVRQRERVTRSGR
jgi:hypothetical protein